MIQALLFDYFGVIRPNGHGIRPTYKKLGGDLVADEPFLVDVITAAGYGFIQDMDQQIADRLGVKLSVWNEAINSASNHDQELLAYIAALRSQGLKTAILSNASPESFTRYFKPGEAEMYFDAVFSSGDSGLVKPEPAFYHLAADTLGVDYDACLMIDDREAFCSGAQQAGMQALHYTDFAHFRTELSNRLTHSH